MESNTRVAALIIYDGKGITCPFLVMAHVIRVSSAMVATKKRVSRKCIKLSRTTDGRILCYPYFITKKIIFGFASVGVS